jgi:hypothetical protein
VCSGDQLRIPTICDEHFQRAHNSMFTSNGPVFGSQKSVLMAFWGRLVSSCHLSFTDSKRGASNSSPSWTQLSFQPSPHQALGEPFLPGPLILRAIANVVDGHVAPSRDFRRTPFQSLRWMLDTLRGDRQSRQRRKDLGLSVEGYLDIIRVTP